MKRTFIAALLAISFAACSINYEKAPSGLTYKIFKGNGTQKPKAGEFIKFNVEFRLMDRDSVLKSTFGSLPGYGPVDTSKRAQYSFMEIIPLMNVGDSAVVSMSIDSLKNKGMIQGYDPLFVKGQVMLAKVKLLQVFKKEGDVEADYKKSLDDEKGNEEKAIEAYLAKHNLKGEKGKNGTYVVVEDAGDPALKADSGKKVSVMYRGSLLTNGYVFDTNMDTTKGHTAPLDFVVDAPGMIPGFSDGITFFGKGGKGKLFIPAMLGYGPQAQGKEIPAFSNLIFDIEVKDVTDAPPPQPVNPKVQQMQQQMQKMHQQKQDSTKKK
ncbi:FKBP-type peptidyl-prolyl cis-trans isomerase [Parafilimonas sp.]|uniref:FKBP-type peptidyl-prolyl cis-trans isomerase n=1 Tax=Parafilimonas sp. TaxID=1969739 RepID=UPI0039E544AE